MKIGGVRYPVKNLQADVHYVAGLFISRGVVSAYVQIKAKKDIAKPVTAPYLVYPCYDLAKQQNTIKLDHIGGTKEVFQRHKTYTTFDLMRLKQANPAVLKDY